MDEPTLRVYIQKLTKKLIPEFEKTTDAKERIELVLNEPILEPLKSDNFQKYIKANWPRKNERLSAQNREDGNAAFQSGNHDLAVVLYTEAMKYSPVDDTVKEGEAMAIAVANRYIYNYNTLFVRYYILYHCLIFILVSYVIF